MKKPLACSADTNKNEQKDQLDWEKELLGLYISDHPLNAYLRQVEDKISHNSNALAETEENSKVTVGGVVNRLRPIRTKKDQMMAFVTLSDAFGDMDLVLFPKTWEQYQQIIDVGTALLVEGKAQHRDSSISILVDKVSLIESGTELAEGNESLSGPFYEMTIERNLPDMRLLSRYAWPPANPEQGSEPEEPGEESDQIYSETPPWENEPEFMDDPFFESQIVEHIIIEEPIAVELEVPTSVESEPEALSPKVESVSEEIEYVDQESVRQLPSKILVVTCSPAILRKKTSAGSANIMGGCSHPGQDLFGFRLMGPDGWQVVYYPNFPIEINDSIVRRLEQDLGKENVMCQAYGPILSF